jgi:alpha-mannosidase
VNPETRGTLYLIGNAHIDPVWLWDWREGYAEVKATFRSALDRLNEYPEFLFTASSAAHYAWVERSDPAMFEEIKARVREGRWEIVGGWWVQPDCNLPGGESFVRQGLYGQRYFQRHFGVTAEVGYNPDSFGHAATLPMILRGQGLHAYTFMRPGPHEKGLPARSFEWESTDGSRVKTFRIPFEYCTTGKDLEPHVRKVTTEVRPPQDRLMCFYGVGNHGGGPTKENLESLRRMQQDSSLPALKFSTPNRFFKAIENLELPVVHDELQHHASGCYAAHSGIKREMRRAEFALLGAERFSALAARVVGTPYPKADLERAWHDVLFHQFHDILAGTSLESTYDDSRDELGEAKAIAARALNDAVQALSWRVDIPLEEGVKPIVVFNPHAWQSRSSVELEIGGLKDGDGLFDDAGNEIPHQTVRSEATVSGWRKRLAFTAELPAFGYRLYRVRPQAATRTFPDLTASDTTLENARYRVEIDPATGGIAKLFDKRVGADVFRGIAARGAVLHDPSDTWSHGVVRFDHEIGSFGNARVKLLEVGPVLAKLRSVSSFEASTLTQDFTLYRDSERIDVHVTVDWHGKHQLLKLMFAPNVRFPKATYELPHGSLERPCNGEEEPMQTWVDLTGVSSATGALYGVSLLNDAKSSFSVLEREMAYVDAGLTVLRSPIYAHHDPYKPTPDGDYRYMDQGEQRFTYSILPHAGGHADAKTVRHAAELNTRAVAVPETFHAGSLPPTSSYASCDADNILVAAIKQCEDDDGIIVRLLETAHRATTATVTILEHAITATFRPGELKTFKLEADKVTETNLLEWAT